MGNTSSQKSVEPDPWWEPKHHHHTTQNVLHDQITTERNTHTQEGDRTMESVWRQRELTLEQTIQHLAQENMLLAVARQNTEKKLEEAHAELKAETQHTSEELDKLRNEADKTQILFEKLHAQIQSGREDRQMITSEMERIRCGFDAEREAKEEAIAEMQKLKEEKDENRRTVENLQEQLTYEKKVIEDTLIMLSKEREGKDSISRELGRIKEELETAKSSLMSVTQKLQTSEVDQDVTHTEECLKSKESEVKQIRSPEARAEMERFQAEMCIRREARQRAMHAVSTEMDRLRTELNAEQEARKQAMQQLEQIMLNFGVNRKSKPEETLSSELEQLQQKIKADKKKLKQLSQENERLHFELENGKQILTERTDDLEKIQGQLESEREHTQNQISALKEVVTISKQMLMIRESQVLQMKDKLRDIESSVTNKVYEKLSVDLKSEYESQMENIRYLKGLYEERMKVMLSEKEKLMNDFKDKTEHLETEMKKSAEYEHQLEELKISLSQKVEENSNLQIKLDDSEDKSKNLAKELSHINNLFTQMLIGNTATEMDLDKLTRLLQENHDLITEITIKEDSSEAAATLPKLLLDLITQVDSDASSQSKSSTEETNEQNEAELCAQVSVDQYKHSSEESAKGIAVQDIAVNLPKVWKVLMELLSHHVAPTSTEVHDVGSNSCYKSVDTPSGPRLVISVSQTFLRLKDLILEKKSLQKELTHLQQLNTHLESKLNNQEQKLSLVSSELRKTWNVVDRMQTQHQQLHTHEKILRYELHEKRKLLTELKQELEYCREKWERARQKNSESEVEWRKLRKEFASRKSQPIDLLNNSGESGFSDDREDSCDDDDDVTKTGQLDPGIQDLTNLHPKTGIIRTSSPLENNFSQSHMSITGTGVEESNVITDTSVGQTETTCSDESVTQESHSLYNPPELLNNSQSEFVSDSEVESLPSSESSSSESVDSHSSIIKLNSFITLQDNVKQEHVPKSRRRHSNHDNCSTISLISLFKQQLSFFSRNLDYLNMKTDDFSGQNLEALESIFSLPPIQIPKTVNDNVTKIFPQSFYCCDHDFQWKSSSPSLPLSPSADLSVGTNYCSAYKPNCVTTDESNSHEGKDVQENFVQHNSSSSEINNIQLSDEKNANSSCNHLISTNNVRSSETAESSQLLKSQPDQLKLSRTPEEIAEARAARLKRLEEQCQQLYNKVTRTTHRSTALCNRLEELHEQYRGTDDSSSPSTSSMIPGKDNSKRSVHIPPPFPHNSSSGTIETDSASNQAFNTQTTDSTCTTSHSPTTCIHNTTNENIKCKDASIENSERDRIPSLPHTEDCMESSTTQSSNVDEISQVISIPIPPPLPQNLRGMWLPTCFVQSENDGSGMQNSSTCSANETTTQRFPNTMQRQELQESSISISSTEETNISNKHD